MAREESKQKTPPNSSKQSSMVANVENLLSPRLKSVAAMAGWDEETLLMASLIVEDTPDRVFKQKKRSGLQFKTPPSTTSRRKRRAPRKSPVSIPIPALNLEEEEIGETEGSKKNVEKTTCLVEEKKPVEDELKMKECSDVGSTSDPVLPCMDKLREELSCAICLEICYEPSTTTCGHSFCKKCLRSAADRCGKKCPKCRQLISNGRSCTVNTVLWNTIQLLFPQEVESRKAAIDSSNKKKNNPRSVERRTRGFTFVGNNPQFALSPRPRRRSVSSQAGLDDPALQPLPIRFQTEDLSRLVNRERTSPGLRTRSSRTPSQDADAALALRLQREEVMGALNDQPRSSHSIARANLRAMASRAVSFRRRG